VVVLKKSLKARSGRRRNERGVNERGVTAIEFAFVATPFLMLLFGIFEIMMIFFMQTTLEAAIAEEARKIKTGQAQSTSAPITKTQFKANVCARMMGLGNCATRLFVMVEAQPSSGTLPTPWDDGTLTPGSAADEPYQSTSAGQIVVVRGYYVWKLFTPGLTSAMKNYNDTSGSLGDNNRILGATSAFRNEPFQ
jgi:Flp pilus assembly protein TadG